ncbi:MAG: ABC transporter substrate-binding protein [Clostridia bacterium]|jgi:iron complex transport system substrate-binding protein|nr:ABC transporter substrate-binding protein [Clostridia bacterium]
MNHLKKTFIFLLALVAILSVSGCSQNAGSQGAQPGGSTPPPEQTEQKPVTVVDAIDREVAVPDSIERVAITCQGGTTHQISVMGASGKITAQPAMTQFPMLLKMFPHFNSVINGGSFDNVNIEEIIKADPDMVFVGVTSAKGNKLIEDTGFATYTMYIGSADVETQKKEFGMTGTLLGNPGRANEVVQYYTSKLAMVEKLVAKVPEAEKKSVYYVNGGITKASSGVWGDSLITGSGGINVTKEFAQGAKGAEISVEQVMQWNPDVIVTQKAQGNLEAITGDTRASDLSAIKNRQVYQFPIGAFWWDRPSPEAPLGFMWLATVLYPEYTKEIDLKKETKDFYKTFYNYELSDEEYASFF